MSSVNKVILIGRIGKDPEVRYTGSGQAVCSFSLATSKNWKDKDGNKQEKTEWHRCVVFSKTAEICGQYLHKGSLAYIEGELETRQYKDKQGVDRYVTEIKAQSVQFLSRKEEGRGQNFGTRPSQDDLGYNAPHDTGDVPF